MGTQLSPRQPEFIPEGDVWLPETDEDRAALREQLDRVLASSVFRNSKGCSSLLAHIVRRAMNGENGHLKERALGVEVFGRAPDYDTSTDHVVRSMASEVRKRLAQYYMQPGRAGEIRIDVPSGTYSPRFRVFPARPAPAPEPDPGAEPETMDAAAAVPDAPSLPATPSPPPAARIRPRVAPFAMAALFVLVLSALAIGVMTGDRAEDTLNRFWQPLLAPGNPILLCIGNGDWPGRPAPAGAPMLAFYVTDSQKVYLNDSITLAKIVGLLQQNSRRYRIMPQANVALADFQAGPAVLIGLRSNYWTSSLGTQLRFTVVPGSAPHTLVVRDRKNPLRNDWTVDLMVPYNQVTTDYALVVRALNPKTEQIVVTAAGITHLGTLAAGEFLTNPAQMRKLGAMAPRGWERKNVAILLSTEIIRGSAGTPNIVATDFW